MSYGDEVIIEQLSDQIEELTRERDRHRAQLRLVRHMVEANPYIRTDQEWREALEAVLSAGEPETT